ncbi:MAG: hypothetical protein A2Y97_02285 [Nitrospirae bacterium RBG_13_39_12]|nr:MAG: hypothetical protein A2Y97_02285 [Nitrospirae bacterium RBG_13_39_12]
MTYNRKNIICIFFIVTLAGIIYSNSFDASFHFDDTPAIIENYAIHRFDVREIFSTSTRPVLDLTFALNYYFGKLNVFGYHLVNLLLHMANGVMLYFILLWTINPLNRVSSEISANSVNFKIPLYAGMIFTAHPIQTQAVTYIVSRSSVLATTFYLLAFLFFIRAFRISNPLLLTYRSLLYLIGAFLASCLGMATKQEAATLPLMLLIYDFYFISEGDLKLLRGNYKVHIAMFLTLAVIFYLSFSGLQSSVSFDYTKGVPMPQEEPITSFEYFLTQLHVIPYYIKLLFVPTNLNFDYDWPITKTIDMKTIFFFIFLGSLIILALRLFRKARLISFGILWFFITLSVTSSFVIIYDVIFEHRLYLPSIGFAVIPAFLIGKISGLRIGKIAR